MERTPRIDKQQEGTAKPTEKSRNSNFSRKLLLEKYTWHESTDDQRELHGNPRSELTLQNLSLHQDSDFIPHDEDSDPESLHPAYGIGTTPDLSASTSSASDQGTLAGIIGIDMDTGRVGSAASAPQRQKPYRAQHTAFILRKWCQSDSQVPYRRR
jgi:hypothetical protein